MKHLKLFESFINEGYNLDTLKKYIDAGNRLWVKVDKYPYDKFEVTDINFKDIHDGTLEVRPVSDEDADVYSSFSVHHDEVTEVITK